MVQVSESRAPAVGAGVSVEDLMSVRAAQRDVPFISCVRADSFVRSRHSDTLSYSSRFPRTRAL